MTTNPPSVHSVQGESPIALGDILRLLKKYGLYLVGIMLLGATLAVIWAKFQPKQYDGVGLVHLKQHDSISLSSLTSMGDDYNLKVNTEVIGIMSPAVAEETMTRLNLATNPSFNGDPGTHDLKDPLQRDLLVKQFDKALKVTLKPKTELIEIRFRSKSPVLSALVVNTLINVYLEESFRQRYESTKQVRSFLTQELETLKSKIQTEQNDLLNSESELGVWQTSAKGEDSVQLEEIEGVLAESVKAQSAEYMAQAEYDEMAQNPDAPFPSDLPGVATVNALLSSRETLRAQRASMESRYGPNYPGLVDLKAQESQMDKSIAEARQQAMKGASETVQSARGEEAQLHDKLLALQAKSKAQTPKTVQLEILKAQYMSDQSLYDVLLAALGTGSIQAGLQGQALDKFVDAEVPGLKAFPILSIIGLAGGAIGLIVGLLIVGILALNSDTIETVEQIEQILPIPILAAVPEYRDEIAAMRIAEGDLPLVTLMAPRSAGTEAYRLLRTAITLMPTAQKHRVISLTSCGPSEGKSTTTMNLAVVLATQSKRVLLIDADLRKPTIAQRLKLPATDQPGLSRYLSDDTIEPEACIQTVPEVAGLDVIPVQEIPPFPSELLGQGRLETLLTWARDHYDYVLIDTPPTLLVTDALIVATHCDTLLTVVRIGVAQKRGLQRLRQDFAKFPGKQLGLVVNALPIADTYYGGYGNYRKYYGRKGYGSYGYGEKES